MLQHLSPSQPISNKRFVLVCCYFVCSAAVHLLAYSCMMGYVTFCSLPVLSVQQGSFLSHSNGITSVSQLHLQGLSCFSPGLVGKGEGGHMQSCICSSGDQEPCRMLTKKAFDSRGCCTTSSDSCCPCKLLKLAFLLLLLVCNQGLLLPDCLHQQ